MSRHSHPPPKTIEVACPCCQAALKVDSETGAVLSHKEKEKPKTFQDFTEAVDRFKGEAGRREDAFQKSLTDHKQQKDVLAKKFDELFKQAKENPDAPPPRREFDFD